MIKNYLAIGVLFMHALVFGQANLIEQYDFENGSLVGENGTANFNGISHTYIDNKDGEPGQAIMLDGSGSTALGNVSTDASTGVTISFWLKPSATMSGSFSVVSARPVCNWGNFLDVVGNVTNQTITGGYRTSTQRSAFVALPYTAGVWTKYTFVYDSDAKYVFGYVNGVKTDSTAYQDGQVPASLTSTSLGIASSACVGTDGTLRYAGGVDQVEVFDKALDETEVANMSDFPDRANSIVAEFKLDNLYTPLVPDPSGMADQAIDLDGTSPVLLGNPTIDPSSGFSIAFWAKPSNSNTGSYSVISKRGVCSWDNLLDVTGNTSLMSISGGFRTSSQRSTFVRLDYVADEWAHFAYVFDNSTKYLFGYKDGVKMDSVAYTDGISPTAFAPSTQLSIAGSPCVGADGTLRYKGGIDAIALYDGPLTESEVSNIHQAGLITGVFNTVVEQSLSMYPNPATSSVNLPKGQVEIYNMRGEQVYNEFTPGTLDVSGFEKGLYLVRQNDKSAQLIIE